MTHAEARNIVAEMRDNIEQWDATEWVFRRDEYVAECRRQREALDMAVTALHRLEKEQA